MRIKTAKNSDFGSWITACSETALKRLFHQPTHDHFTPYLRRCRHQLTPSESVVSVWNCGVCVCNLCVNCCNLATILFHLFSKLLIISVNCGQYVTTIIYMLLCLYSSVFLFIHSFAAFCKRSNLRSF